MPKGNPFVVQQANISAQRKLLNQSRGAEFKYSQDVLGGIYGNLKSTVGGFGAKLTSAQGRQLGALTQLAANQKAASGRITRGAGRAVAGNYGGVIGSAMAPALKSVAVKGKAGGKAIAGAVGGGKLLAQGNEAAMQTLGQGVQLAQAGASSNLADALRYRAKNDASLIAQEQMSLDQMRLQNQLDIENYKKKLQIQEAHANGGSAGLTALATTGANATQGLFDQYNTLYKDDGKGGLVALTDAEKQSTVHNADGTYTLADGTTTARTMNAAEAAQNYINTNGIQDPNQQAVIQALSTAMYQAGVGSGKGTYDGNPATLTNAVSQQLAMLYPTLYAKHQKDITGLISSTISQATSGIAATGQYYGLTGLQAGVLDDAKSGAMSINDAFNELRKQGMSPPDAAAALRNALGK